MKEYQTIEFAERRVRELTSYIDDIEYKNRFVETRDMLASRTFVILDSAYGLLNYWRVRLTILTDNDARRKEIKDYLDLTGWPNPDSDFENQLIDCILQFQKE